MVFELESKNITPLVSNFFNNKAKFSCSFSSKSSFWYFVKDVLFSL